MRTRRFVLLIAALGGLLSLPLLAPGGFVKAETPSNLGKLAYIADGDLWVRVLPDGEPKQLTNSGGNSNPLWSPSGEWIALRRGDGSVWVLRDMGEGAVPVQDSSAGGMYAWSPVTDTLALASTAGVVSIASAPDWRVQPVVTVQGEAVYLSGLAWSPDGEWLAYSEDHSLTPLQQGQVPLRYASMFKIRPDGRDRAELLNAGNPSEYGLILAGWSRDAFAAFYWIDQMFSGSLLADGTQLLSVSANGLTAQLLGPEIGMLAYRDFWSESPDGKQLAIAVGGGRETWSNKRVVVVDRASGQLTYLTEPEMAAFSPAWSPDGERIAYVAAPDIGFVGGGNEAKAGAAERRIWIMNKDGSGRHRLTSDGAYRDELPLWSHDGQFLLFARLNAADEASLWLVSSGGGVPQQAASGLRLDPSTTWFGYYGHIDWATHFDWWKGR